jgi:hypothetical protein
VPGKLLQDRRHNTLRPSAMRRPNNTLESRCLSILAEQELVKRPQFSARLFCQ